MVLKADQERLKALLSETVLLLCKNGLEFKSDFCIEALIGITVDQDDVFLISIKETVENELRAAQRAKEEAEKLALEAAQSPAPESPSRTHRKRKRKSPRPQSPSQDKNIKLETSGDRELDNNTSNTSFQDYNDESQHSRNMKFESGGAGDMGGDDEDNSNEIVFVKTENTDDQSLYGGPGQSSFLDSPYQSGMDSSQMSSSFQSPGAHSSHPGTSSWQSPMDSSQQGMSQNPLETQQMILQAQRIPKLCRCHICGKTFRDRSKLSRHVKSIHLGTVYDCALCKTKFNRVDSLRRHQQRCMPSARVPQIVDCTPDKSQNGIVDSPTGDGSTAFSQEMSSLKQEVAVKSLLQEIASRALSQVTSPALSPEITSHSLSHEVMSPSQSLSVTSPSVSTDMSSQSLNQEVILHLVNQEVMSPLINQEVKSPTYNEEMAVKLINQEVTSQLIDQEVTSQSPIPEISSQSLNEEIERSLVETRIATAAIE